MVTYQGLSAAEIDRKLFASFQRTQVVTRCWRKIEGEWTIQDISFIDDWSAQEQEKLVRYLKEVAQNHGFVAGAFDDGQLKGFVCVEPALFGSCNQYVDLSNLHVSQDARGKGIGKSLFSLAKKWARNHGAKKLYLSAHSAVESQAFYRAMGCVEALEYNQELVEKEPCDCQLECAL